MKKKEYPDISQQKKRNKYTKKEKGDNLFIKKKQTQP